MFRGDDGAVVDDRGPEPTFDAEICAEAPLDHLIGRRVKVWCGHEFWHGTVEAVHYSAAMIVLYRNRGDREYWHHLNLAQVTCIELCQPIGGRP